MELKPEDRAKLFPRDEERFYKTAVMALREQASLIRRRQRMIEELDLLNETSRNLVNSYVMELTRAAEWFESELGGDFSYEPPEGMLTLITNMPDIEWRRRYHGEWDEEDSEASIQD